MQPYIRKTNYYETDRMGIIHHSNYIRWFEEARIDFMNQANAPYVELEAAGVMIPVLGVECTYHSMVRFGDTVEIEMKIVEYTGTRMAITYRVTDQATGALRTTGSSRHCFLGANGRPVSLKKVNPRYDAVFRAHTQKE